MAAASIAMGVMVRRRRLRHTSANNAIPVNPRPSLPPASSSSLVHYVRVARRRLRPIRSSSLTNLLPRRSSEVAASSSLSNVGAAAPAAADDIEMEELVPTSADTSTSVKSVSSGRRCLDDDDQVIIRMDGLDIELDDTGL